MENKVYTNWRWVILATGFITLFIAYSIRIGAYSILLPEMTRAEAGMIKSAFGVSYLLFSPCRISIFFDLGPNHYISTGMVRGR